MKIKHFVCYRTWPVTATNAKKVDTMRNDTGQAHETDRTFWMLLKHCACPEVQRRVPPEFGDLESLEFGDQIKVPYKTPPQPVATWFGTASVQDWEMASRSVRCKHCQKTVWGDFTWYEEFVQHWGKSLIIYERFHVDPAAVMKEDVFRLVKAEAGNASHYEMRLLTPREKMKYLGYADFTAVEEN